MLAENQIPENLSGTILVASPILRDPNFRKTILFVSSHSQEDGAVAFVLNRPLGSSVKVPAPEGTIEAEIHYGGPVQPDALVLASLQWRDKQNLVAFRTFTNEEIPAEWSRGLRAFAGYAGWSPGQLEGEIARQSWLVLAPSRALIEIEKPEGLWDDIIASSSPMLRLLAAAPDDPGLN